MDLVIFGASGQTGRLVVAQALQRGHTVRAFARNLSPLEVQHTRLTRLAGDVSDAGAVTRAVAGTDAVICTLGSNNPLRSYPAFRIGVRHLLGAMRSTGVSRLIYLSFLGVRPGRRQLRWPFKSIAPLLLPGSVADHEANEAEIRQSGVEWTIVRAPKLGNGPPSGRVRSGEEIRAQGRFPVVARADVASFMVDELVERRCVRQAPALLP